MKTTPSDLAAVRINELLHCHHMNSEGIGAFSLPLEEVARIIESEYAPVLLEAMLQIEYLHKKFKETGSGNQILAKLRGSVK